MGEEVEQRVFTREDRAKYRHKIRRSLDGSAAMVAIVERQLEDGGPYITGPDFTLADIAIAVSVHRIRSLPGAPPLPPVVKDYMARLAQRPAYTRYCGPGTP